MSPAHGVDPVDSAEAARTLARDELRARRPGGHGRLYWQTKQARAGRQVGLFPLVPSNGLVHGSTVTIALPAAVATRDAVVAGAARDDLNASASMRTRPRGCVPIAR